MYYLQGKAITAKMNRERKIHCTDFCTSMDLWDSQQTYKADNYERKWFLDSKRLSILSTNINVYTISERL